MGHQLLEMTAWLILRARQGDGEVNIIWPKLLTFLVLIKMCLCWKWKVFFLLCLKLVFQASLWKGKASWLMIRGKHSQDFTETPLPCSLIYLIYIRARHKNAVPHTSYLTHIRSRLFVKAIPLDAGKVFLAEVDNPVSGGYILPPFFLIPSLMYKCLSYELC